MVAAFNQEKALVGAFSVLTNLRMELFQALLVTRDEDDCCEDDAEVEVVVRRLLEGAGLDAVREEAEDGAEPEQQREPAEQVLAELDPLGRLGRRRQSVGAISLLAVEKC